MHYVSCGVLGAIGMLTALLIMGAFYTPDDELTDRESSMVQSMRKHRMECYDDAITSTSAFTEWGNSGTEVFKPGEYEKKYGNKDGLVFDNGGLISEPDNQPIFDQDGEMLTFEPALKITQPGPNIEYIHHTGIRLVLDGPDYVEVYVKNKRVAWFDKDGNLHLRGRVIQEN